MQTDSIPIIGVTGTKGKTTVVNVLSDVLQRLAHNVLHVDTSGHFVNGERRSVAADSLRIWNIRTVTAMPGKYLGEFLKPELQVNPAAVLECSFSCSTRGLGYGSHKVGVFLNVFEDHIDPRGPIKNRADLARAKSFIFSKIGEGGYAVFNADDEMVCGVLDQINADKGITLVPCGIEFTYFDLATHLANGGAAITVEDGSVVLKREQDTEIICRLSKVSWAFNGNFKPSVMNLLHACGALYGFFDGTLPVNFQELLESSRLNPETGRLVLLRAANGATIIADYAHEKVSLQSVSVLARTLIKDSGSLIGVVRLAHERSDEVLRETGYLIAESFDEVVVYDKIDGHWRKPRPPYMKRYPQVVGRTSQVLADAVSEKNSKVTRIIREDEAVEFAAQHAGPNDVVVIILNDDIKRSLGFIQNSFKAEVR
jgi:UDP-N-acetylmuramyl tripeptide synthase